MTEERDPKISAAYRELGAEEPPRALDDAILAAARREAGARPASLAQRAGRQRWYAPLATAAVLVLAVALTWNMQREQPGVESPAQPAAAPPPAADRAVAKTAETMLEKEIPAPATAEDVKVARHKAEARPAIPAAVAPAAAPEPKPFKTDQPAMGSPARSDESRSAASGVTGSLSQPLEALAARDRQAAARAEVGESAKPADSAVSAASAERANRGVAAAAPARMQAQNLADTPERELERIAELRAKGSHDEADKALAEFRKRYPEYRIPEAMRVRVERR
jgi:hypothetical protein